MVSGACFSYLFFRTVLEKRVGYFQFFLPESLFVELMPVFLYLNYIQPSSILLFPFAFFFGLEATLVHSLSSGSTIASEDSGLTATEELNCAGTKALTLG